MGKIFSKFINFAGTKSIKEFREAEVLTEQAHLFKELQLVMKDMSKDQLIALRDLVSKSKRLKSRWER